MRQPSNIGKLGELRARQYLEENGYEILEANWRFKKKEVDLIALKDRRLVFVEVKARSSSGFGEPEEFVGSAKQGHLISAANEYLYISQFQGEIRFDIVSILFRGDSVVSFRHIEDAFWRY